MAPKAKPKAKPKPKAKGKAKAAPPAASPPPLQRQPSQKRAASPAASPPPLKRQKSSDSPAIKRSQSSEALQKAKRAASSGQRGGKSVVDREVPGRENLKIYEDYAIKLNQTHIEGGANNNKFYIIQVLEGSGKYYAWNRWGRVGEPGQNKLAPFGNAAGAIKDFEKKFQDKTRNNWANRANFKAVNGKYHLVETEDTEGGGDDAPLGKLTEAQIGKGQSVLEKLEKELKKGNAKNALEVLSSEFYTLIPHNFGRQRAPAIDTDDKLQAKVELLKFYLRMGFEEVEEEASLTPIDGVMNLPLPATLAECGVGSSSVKGCNTQGEKLAAKQAGKPSSRMAGALYASIMMYTSNAIYKDLNEALRNENRAKIKKYFKYLRLFLEALNTLPKQKRTLWRGMGIDLHDSPLYTVGNTVTWWGVSSTTSDKAVAHNFAKGCGGNATVLTIETQTSSDISDITFYSNEKESLLAPGTQLQVLSKKRTGKLTEISLKEVGRVLG